MTTGNVAGTAAGDPAPVNTRAEDPETSGDELERLSRHRSRSVRAAVAGNANTPTPVLEVLGRVFPEAVAGNPILDWLLLEDANWLGTFDEVTRQRLLMEPGVGQGLLWWAARFGEVDDQLAVTQNPFCPIEILTLLADSGYPPVERNARAHINMSAASEATSDAASDADASPSDGPSERGSVDLSMGTSEWGGPSSSGPEISVLIDIGAVPPNLFGALIEGDIQVRRSIATSPQTAPPVLGALLLDDDEITRESARSHPSTSAAVKSTVEALEANRADVDFTLLEGLPIGSRAELMVARHPQCPKARHQEFTDDPNWRLREAVAANPSIALNNMVQLAADNDKDVRVALTTNPSLPLYVLALLTEDRVEEVAQSARHQFVIRLGDETDETDETDSSASADPVGQVYPADAARRQETPAARFARVGHSEDGRDALMALIDSTPGVGVLLGRHRLIPIDLLRTLSADPDWRVRLACASNHAAPEDVLDRLMRDADSDVRGAALRNPSATDDLVKNVADPSHPEVRRRLAQLATSPQGLELYAIDTAAVVRAAVAEHDLVALSTLEVLASDIDEGVRLRVASSEQLTAEAIVKLAGDTEPAVQQRIAERDDLPDLAVVQLFQDKRQTNLAKRADQCRQLLSGTDRSSRSDVALLKDAPSWLRQHVIRRCSDIRLLTAMAESDDWQARACVAQHPLLTEALLQKLAADPDYDVRTAIASLAQSLPHNVLHDLACDGHSSVRAAIIARPDLDQCVVEEMVFDEDDDVRAAVTAHPRLSDVSKEIYRDLAAGSPMPPELLKELANSSPLSRRLVAQHPSTPARVLNSLSRDENWRVREDVARHPKTTRATLQRLGTESDRDVRRAVALNPSTSASLLTGLLDDADESVRVAASRHPRLPRHLRSTLHRAALRKLARSNAPHDRLVFVSAASCSPIELRRRRHWQAAEWQIRLAVATHANTPSEIVERLALDANPARSLRRATPQRSGVIHGPHARDQRVPSPVAVEVTVLRDDCAARAVRRIDRRSDHGHRRTRCVRQRGVRRVAEP